MLESIFINRAHFFVRTRSINIYRVPYVYTIMYILIQPKGIKKVHGINMYSEMLSVPSVTRFFAFFEVCDPNYL